MDSIDAPPRCPFCNVTYVSPDVHKQELQHRMNYALRDFRDHRQSLIKDRDGIEITNECPGRESTFARNRGVINVIVPEGELNGNGIVFVFQVINRRRTSMVLTNVMLLHPYSLWIGTDAEGMFFRSDVAKAARLKPGAVYDVMVRFNGVNTSSYQMPISFNLQTETVETGKEPRSLSIIRVMQVDICRNEEVSAAAVGKSPFTGEAFNVGRRITINNRPLYANVYGVPEKLIKLLSAGLCANDAMTQLERDELFALRREVESGEPTLENYASFFKILLWIEEVQNKKMLNKYNMTMVNLTLNMFNVIELEVPGLAEKRPSLVRGDIVLVRRHKEEVAFEGYISQVHDKKITINFNSGLIQIVQETPMVLFDVRFELNRLTYERMHRGVHLCADDYLHILFPVVPVKRNPLIAIQSNEFVNQSVATNPEQRTAVMHILSKTSMPAPYIVFGPPGTGKTLTIVEAIVQISRKNQGDRILVCAPSNAACDMLATKLVDYFNTDELLRFHSQTRDWGTIPESIKYWSNETEDFKRIFTPAQLMEFRVVICTLVLSGKYVNSDYKPNFVFIDEAAQAKEPEAIIPLGVATTDCMIVLAGDPMQLGPVCMSKHKLSQPLNRSLLERLMDTNDLYHPQEQGGTGHYNPRFITKLKKNFRSHPDILEIPNKLFYENELQAKSSKVDTQLSTLNLFSGYSQSGRAVEFHSVLSMERREGRSPSYFNTMEIELVMRYLTALFSEQNPVPVSCANVGIITPYMRQVSRLKERLKRKGWQDVEVGTVEAFQGREKLVVIISAVRSQTSLLEYDAMYKLGFVSDVKRFNVAITRAISKLVVIGNPHCLCYSSCWCEYIKMCRNKGSFRGAPFSERNKHVQKDILERIGGFSDPLSPCKLEE